MNEIISIKTGKPAYDNFFPLIKSFLEKDILEVTIDGKRIRGYRSPDAKSIWIRDYSDMMRGIRYFETDLKSTVEHFAETQAQNGRIFDYFTTFPEKQPGERENWTKYVRIPVEADVEYRFVKAAFLSWQATGDDFWMEKLLPAMEKALNYVLNHPWRWEEKIGLVKRAYTIDTWDFAYSAEKSDWLQFQINDNTYWGIMHGDNSGYFEAFQIMAFLYGYFQHTEKSILWMNRAETLRNILNKTCWNGNFYTHFVKLTPLELPGVDESTQLSLSNPKAINRGVASQRMATLIIEEYQKRREKNNSFAEWYSIDPPFPAGTFADDKLVPGAYINGGIMPLVGGELAKAAFDHGYEKYGVDILSRYYQMISESGATYLWYFPDGTASSVETSTSPDATPSDGWGCSAMLYGFMEGLVGIQDKFKRFQNVYFSPKWIAADVKSAEIRVGYQASQAYFNYVYHLATDCLELEIDSPFSQVQFHILLPSQTSVQSVRSNGEKLIHHSSTVRRSTYVDFCTAIHDQAKITIEF